MPKVTLITPGKKEVTLKDAIGTLMEAAVDADVEGIDGDCGGVCSCSTCHVHVAPEWVERVGPPNETEADTLEFDERTTARSRLSCQIELNDELDGLVVEIPDSQ
ncbi:MAG: 2Fe-2S iron-sulfur cluster binding domain-containing protein [Verrucomicrobia bacterium]|jgi:2Fe-2S ferredoxin|nr:2Fe-2S iron-sulfur cluster binding domain-containing protein [Verrucomicrobiota bacterium]